MRDKYHEDYQQKILDIRNNIAACPQTSAAERGRFLKAIDVVLDAMVGIPEESTLEAIEGSFQHISCTMGLLLKGTKQKAIANQELWHTTPSIRFENQIKSIMMAKDDALALDSKTLQKNVETLIGKLQTSTMFQIHKSELGNHKLQAIARPLWLGDPKSSTPPVSDPADYPACAGIAPTTGTHYRLIVRHPAPLLPRFADSGGYPYWRPGGRTLPIPESTYKMGICEAVVGDLCVDMLAAPISDFYRLI